MHDARVYSETAESLQLLDRWLPAAPSYAGYAVRPSDGLTITSRNPSFLVYVDDGDTTTQVEVSTSPEHNAYGFTGCYVRDCSPTTPSNSADRGCAAHERPALADESLV